jgi:merozoite surface protein 4
VLAAAGTLALGVGSAVASQGADDPAGHNAGDDHGGLVSTPAGGDDQANHDANDDRLAGRTHHHSRVHARSARRHADDGPNHDAGDDHGGDR